MFHFCSNLNYRMPVLFGGTPYDASYEATAYDSLFVTYVQHTSSKALENYLPEGFSLLEPTITYQYIQLREVNFLAGGAYNIVQAALSVHYQGRKDCLDGALPLVVWENNTIPILGGREESGIPKIYADINDINSVDGSYQSTVSFQGNTFLTFDLSNLCPYSNQEFIQEQQKLANANVFGIRYIPHIGAPGAELIQFILYPQSVIPYEMYHAEGTLNLRNLPYSRGLIHATIVEQLSALPVFSMECPSLMKGKLIMRSPVCREIF